MRYRLITIGAALTLSAAAAAQQGTPEWKGKNLQFFPADIQRDVLTQRMREFSFALGVRCQYCHFGGDGISFEGVDFSSDAKPAKNKARAMLKMTDQLNRSLLPQVPSRAEPHVTVECATCHRGLPLPKTLQTTLYEIVKKDGAPAAVAKYRDLRNSDTLSGHYNFGEWEINELARRLADDKDTASAIAILEMNEEFYPKSPSIDFQIGELHRTRGEKDLALASYRKTLDKAPDHQGAKARIAELSK